MWLSLHDDEVTVDARRYIACQPVEYDQVEDVIAKIRHPMRARIDLAGVRLRDVNLMGVVRIIWELHEQTEGQDLLESITFHGASPRVLYLWNVIQPILPDFVAILVKFDSFRDESTSDENEDEWNQNEGHEA